MVAQIQLYNLVDLALCDPDIGCVNFNHLRTLLHSMLKLNNQIDILVPFTPTTGTTDAEFEGKEGNKVSFRKDDQEVSSQVGADVEYNGESKDEEEQSVKFSRLFRNQSKFEERISTLEKNIQASVDFPSNYEILNENRETLSPVQDGEEINKLMNEDSNTNIHNHNNTSKLSLIWENKKMLKRIESSEEAIGKLFSLMNEILHNNKSELVTKCEFENMKNQIVDLQNTLSQYRQDVNDSLGNIENNKYSIDQCLNNLNNLSKIVNANSSDLGKYLMNMTNTGDASMETEVSMVKDEQPQETSTMTSNLNSSLINKFMSMLDNKADLSELGNKVNTSELDNKANITDLKVMQNEIFTLQTETREIQEKLSNLTKQSDLSEVMSNDNNNNTDFNTLHEKLEFHVTQTDKNFLEQSTELEQLRKELVQIKQSISNIDDDKLRNMLDNIEELKKLSNEKDKMDANEKRIQDISIQVEQSKKVEDEIVSKINDLIKVHENILSSQDELKMSMPTFDASVMAAIQHLSQENRHQITALQNNVKVLQKSQMSLQPSVTKSDEGSTENLNVDTLQNLQNHFLTLQEEQVEQSGHISNMVDDYKEEFNRKQLHIDALYDYVDKLQNNKADRNDITVEMDIKADKISLDNKVNMSTFDERYQMLEQSLQQALSRLDQYAEDETSLKDALHKLSKDLNSKMDTEAERKLKKFLDTRLKEIQESRTRLPNIEVDPRNAAGLRKPMPLSYNCLSCDRPIDITMRGVMPPVPNYLPSKNPLGSVKTDKVNSKISNTSYDGMAINRQCGGSHTSVNINMLRMMKINPLQNLSESNVITKTSGNNLPITDCVMGNDGQIYRGRLIHGSSDGKQNGLNGRKHRQRKTRSAKSPSKVIINCQNIDERSHSATCVDKADSEESFSLPPINKDRFQVSLQE